MKAERQTRNVELIELVANLQPLPMDGEPGTLQHVQLLPLGTHDHPSGPFTLDAEAVAACIARFESDPNDEPTDYDHALLRVVGLLDPPADKAPASGWIKRMTNDGPAGLGADVEWTPEAAAAIRAKKYRYLSPVVLRNKRTGRVTGIHSAGLTNKPNNRGTVPLANSQDARAETGQEEDMALLETARQSLGLAEDASGETVADALNTLAFNVEADGAGDEVIGKGKAVLADAGVELGDDADAAAVAASLRELAQKITVDAGGEGGEGGDESAANNGIGKSRAEQIVANIRRELGIKNATGRRVKTEEAVANMRRELDGYKADNEALKAQVEALVTEARERDADEFLAANARKIPPKARDQIRELVLANRQQAEELVAALPDLVAEGRMPPPAADPKVAGDRIVANSQRFVGGEQMALHQRIVARMREKGIRYSEAYSDLIAEGA